MAKPNFTPRARQMIHLAEKLAGPLGCEYVGTEHLLLAMTKLNSGIGYEILRNYGLTEKKLTEILNKLHEE